MPPVAYSETATPKTKAKMKAKTASSDELTRLLEATKIGVKNGKTKKYYSNKWKGKGRARNNDYNDLEAQNVQLDGGSNSRPKEGSQKGRKKNFKKNGQVAPSQASAEREEIIERGNMVVRYYRDSVTDDWPTSCAMVTIVLALGATTLLLIVFFGNLEIRRPKV